MPDSSNVSREAEALARLFYEADQGGTGVDRLWRDFFEGRAERAVAAGWTPPPDPHEEIARTLWEAIVAGAPPWDPQHSASQTDLLAAVRRFDLRRGADSDAEYRRGWEAAMRQSNPPMQGTNA